MTHAYIDRGWHNTIQCNIIFHIGLLLLFVDDRSNRILIYHAAGWIGFNEAEGGKDQNMEDDMRCHHLLTRRLQSFFKRDIHIHFCECMGKAGWLYSIMTKRETNNGE
jgi:hypothetical protein